MKAGWQGVVARTAGGLSRAGGRGGTSGCSAFWNRFRSKKP